MPYIKQWQRDSLDTILPDPEDAGELNYVLTKVALRYFKRCGGRYAQINDVMGAFSSAQAEFYRRIAAPYEDQKITQNGDVYS